MMTGMNIVGTIFNFYASGQILQNKRNKYFQTWLSKDVKHLRFKTCNSKIWKKKKKPPNRIWKMDYPIMGPSQIHGNTKQTKKQEKGR